MGIFRGSDPWFGVSESVRRALAHLKDGGQVTKIAEALTAMKIKHVKPVWKQEAAAHLGIPSLKIAVLVVHVHDTVKDSKIRKDWERYGWTCFIVTRRHIDYMSAEDLRADLTEALESVKVGK